MYCILSLLVVVEALSTLLSEPLRVDHALQEDARAVLGIAGISVERLLDSQAGIQSNAI